MAYRSEVPVSVYAAVYEAIDASVALGRSLPSTEACIQGALARFRSSGADEEAVRQLESMSVGLHRLIGSRSDAAAQLTKLARCWMERAPMH